MDNKDEIEASDNSWAITRDGGLAKAYGFIGSEYVRPSQLANEVRGILHLMPRSPFVYFVFGVPTPALIEKYGLDRSEAQRQVAAYQDPRHGPHTFDRYKIEKTDSLGVKDVV